MHKWLHPLYSRPNKLTSLCQFLRFYKTVHRTILQREKPTHEHFTLSIHRFLHLTLTVIFSCGRLQIAYNQRVYTKCYPNIFLSVYIHVNTKTVFSFFQYPHTSLFVFAYPQQPRLLLFVYKFQILLQKQSYSFHDS